MITVRVVVFVLCVAVLVLAVVAFARIEVEWDPAVAPVIDSRTEVELSCPACRCSLPTHRNLAGVTSTPSLELRSQRQMVSGRP
jgi:hypothetical protein